MAKLRAYRYIAWCQANLGKAPYSLKVEGGVYTVDYPGCAPAVFTESDGVFQVSK